MKNLVFLGIIDWHFRLQRPQRIPIEMVRTKGFSALYVNPNFSRSSEFRWETQEVETGIEVVRIGLPDRQPSLFLNRFTPFEAYLISKKILEWSSFSKGNDSVVVVQHPAWRPIVGFLKEMHVVYDMMDLHRGFHPEFGDKFQKDEERLLDSSASVVVTSSHLRAYAESRRDVAFLVRNAASESPQSTPSAISRINQPPRIGYVGAIADWFNSELVHVAARKLPEFEFHFYGEVSAYEFGVATYPSNVYFHGEVHRSRVPEIMTSFDVGIIPFRKCDLIDATDPVKAYEYLSFGLPVVGANTPELEHIGNGLCVNTTTSRDFIREVERAVAWRRDPLFSRRCSEFVASNLWAQRAEDFSAACISSPILVSVVVLHYGEIGLTVRCLRSIAQIQLTSRYKIETVLVCNGTDIHDVNKILGYCTVDQTFKLVVRQVNDGFSAGMNDGIRNSTGEIVVLLNNDTQVHEGSISRLVDHLLSKKSLGAVGPLTNETGNDAKLYVDTSKYNWKEKVSLFCSVHWGSRVKVQNLSFFCVAIRRDVIDEVGLLDEEFGIGMFEDDDYCRRLIQHGYELAICHDAFVFHEHSANFKLLGKQYEVLFERNRRIFEERWGPWDGHNNPRKDLDVEAFWLSMNGF